jgi:hypothetical protein
MTGPAADAERETLGGGDAVSRAVRASDGVELPLPPLVQRTLAAGHTLDFEVDRRRYLADMVGWLLDRARSGSSGSVGGGR